MNSLACIPSMVLLRTQEFLQAEQLLQLSAVPYVLVLQGEVAHVSLKHAQVVFTKDATTCICLAIRSTNDNDQGDDNNNKPLVSLAHIDKIYPTSNLEAMLQEHIQHHHQEGEGDDEEEEKHNSADDDFFFYDDDDQNEVLRNGPQKNVNVDDSSNSFLPTMSRNSNTSLPPSQRNNNDKNNLIPVELHLCGGYDTQSSHEISNWLLQSFICLAEKYQHILKITLSTTATMLWNTTRDENNRCVPNCRGLGIEIASGHVFPYNDGDTAACPDGPAMDRRAAHRWAVPNQDVTVIHNRQGEIHIPSFEMKLPSPNSSTTKGTLDALLQAPDDVLLRVTSTSPECESDQFCSTMRRTLSYLLLMDEEDDEDGRSRKKSLVYSRSADCLNAWELIE